MKRLTKAQKKQVANMWNDGKHVDEICANMTISKATAYRWRKHKRATVKPTYKPSEAKTPDDKMELVTLVASSLLSPEDKLTVIKALVRA